MSRKALVLVTWLAVLGIAPAPVSAAGSGWLYLKKLIPDNERARFPGFVEPQLYVYDDAGSALPSPRPGGFYGAGELVELPEGTYQIEITHAPSPANRWRYEVKGGQVTIVQSGLVHLSTIPTAQQTPDSCPQWRAVMYVWVQGDGGELEPVMNNQEAPVDDLGILQLHPGRYTVAFNELRTEIDVKADQTLLLPLVLVPAANRDYRLSMRQDSAADNPSLTLCRARPTQILAGRYWGSYTVDTQSPPYKKRVWEELDFTEKKPPAYKRTPKDEPAKKILFRGPGSRPKRVPPPAAGIVPEVGSGGVGRGMGAAPRPKTMPAPGPVEVNPLPSP